jgi:hypothetical protein
MHRAYKLTSTDLAYEKIHPDGIWKGKIAAEQGTDGGYLRVGIPYLWHLYLTFVRLDQKTANEGHVIVGA